MMELQLPPLTWRTVVWVLLALVVLYLLRAFGYRFSRVVGLFVLAGQLPGDVPQFVDDLAAEPRETFGALTRAEVLHFLKCAWWSPQKMTIIGHDETLVRLRRLRERFEQEGWLQVTITTRDKVALDGCILPPPRGVGKQRWVLFMNANMQKYEEWLFYFHRYAKDLGVGMLVFNWRGVGHSQGAAISMADLVRDGQAALQFLVDREVHPANILVHGLSIGACVAATVRAKDKVAHQGPVLLDRPFSTLAAVLKGYEAFAMEGQLRQASGCKRALAQCGLGFLAELVGWILLFTGWQGRTLRHFRRIKAARIVTYHRKDNIIHIDKASLYQALVNTYKEPPSGPAQAGLARQWTMSNMQATAAVRWYAVELATNQEEWLPHDMPLYLDSSYAQITELVRRALGMGDDSAGDGAGLSDEEGGEGAHTQTVADHARSVLLGRPGGGGSDAATNGAYTRML
mmetsp:Transcript_15559/g.41761  ORF Transcript_15559/g.41761 Transcript_15559/m.41761 type:complete len:458 (-) Transcript_15559:375-1748(-)